MRHLGLALLLALPTLALTNQHAPKHGADLEPLSRFSPKNIKVSHRLFPGTVLTVTPDTLAEGGAYLTVSWKVLLPRKAPYFVAMYLENDDVTATVPIKFMVVQSGKEEPSLKAGGDVKFWAVNMRKNIVFGLFRGLPEDSELLLKSNVVTLESPNEPTSGRLTHTTSPDEMTVSWITGDGAKGQTLQFGSFAGKLDHSLDATRLPGYNRLDMCGGVAKGKGFRDPGTFWTATMTGLSPGDKVHYRYGSDADGWSEPGFFFPRPTPDMAVKVFVFGDLGTHSPDATEQPWDSVASRNSTDAMFLESLGRTLAFHVGDISYAVGYASKWDDFGSQIAPIATRMPYMTAIGNHERDWPGGIIAVEDSGGECGVPYDLRFPMPGTDRDAPWYSFDHGPVHFTVISSEHDLDDQYKFVIKDLAAVNRTITPWVVFATHRPLYVSSTNSNIPDGDQTMASQLRNVFEELLYVAEVDIVLAGHHHSYQRTCPVFKGACTKPRPNATADAYMGPVHIIAGMAGAASTTNIQTPQPPIYQMVDAEHHGYMRLNADKTTLSMEYVRTDDSTIHDKFTLTRPPPPPPTPVKAGRDPRVA